jgi:cephalosporin hydroxylase
MHDALWRGIPLWKFPTDISLYHEVIHEKKPDTIVEIGTAHGGSSLYLQDMLDICNPGSKVITVDIRDRLRMERDDRITYIIGNSVKRDTAAKVNELVSGNVMVIIDGNHERKMVKWDLYLYSKMVTQGQYLVVEDCYNDRGLFGPGEAKEWFLKAYDSFEQTDRCSRYMVGMTMDGWLIKK